MFSREISFYLWFPRLLETTEAFRLTKTLNHSALGSPLGTPQPQIIPNLGNTWSSSRYSRASLPCVLRRRHGAYSDIGRFVHASPFSRCSERWRGERRRGSRKETRGRSPAAIDLPRVSFSSAGGPYYGPPADVFFPLPGLKAPREKPRPASSRPSGIPCRGNHDSASRAISHLFVLMACCVVCQDKRAVLMARAQRGLRLP